MIRDEGLIKILGQKNLSLTELSKKSNVSYETIILIIERDFKNASIESAIKIANALNVELSDFIPEISLSKSYKQLEKEHKALKKEHEKLIENYDKFVREITRTLWKHL